MKRGAALKRYTPLRARKGLQAKSAPARAKGLRQVSRKRAAEMRERRAMAVRRYGGEVPLCAWPGAPHWADAFHEPLTRARGGSCTDEANTVPMCNEHNGLLATLTGAELGAVYAAGLLKHSWEVPGA